MTKLGPRGTWRTPHSVAHRHCERPRDASVHADGGTKQDGGRRGAKDGAASGIFHSARCVIGTRRAQCRAMGAFFPTKLAETFGIFCRLSDSTNDGGDVAHVPRRA